MNDRLAPLQALINEVEAAFRAGREYAYIETGKYKTHADVTVRAITRRGYQVERQKPGLYFVRPKRTGNALRHGVGVYCPELGEAAPARVLFHSEYNYRGYSLCWKVDDDAAARRTLRELRIFPRHVVHRAPSESLEAKRLDSDVFSCLITMDAHRKLRDAGQVAIRTLLD